MSIVPVRNRLIYPAGVAPGFDPSHPAARNCRVSAIPSGVNFLNLLTGKLGVMSAVAGTPVAKTLAVTGPTVYMGGPGSALESICTFTGAMKGVKSHNYTFGVIFAANPNNSVTGGLIGADNYNTSSSSIPSNGFGFSISDFRGSFAYQLHDVGVPDFDLYFYDHDFSNYSDLTVYFLAVSASFPGGGSGPINIAIKPLRDDPYFSGRNRVVTKTLTGAGDTASALRTGDVFLGGDSAQYIAAATYSDTFMSIAELRAWADDPWGFWYPRQNDIAAFQPLTPPTPYVPTFRTNVRQWVLPNAVVYNETAAPPSSVLLAALARAQVRITAAALSGLTSAANLLGLSRIAVRSRAAASGATALAGRSMIETMGRGALAGAVSLAGRTIVETMARAVPSGAASLAARASAAVKARAGIAGSVALAGRTIIETMGRIIPPGAIALLGLATARVVARAAGPLASTSLAGRTILRASGRLVPPGAIALIAQAFARLTGRAQPQGATSLSGRSRAQVQNVMTLTPAAQLGARSKLTARSRASATATTALEATAKAVVRGRGALTATLSFVALSSRTALRAAARAILTRLGVPFTEAPRSVMPDGQSRSVQVEGEDRSING